MRRKIRCDGWKRKYFGLVWEVNKPRYVDNKKNEESGINGFLHRGEEEHKGGPIACNNVTPTKLMDSSSFGSNYLH
jgi:hypothetical protein